MTQIRIDPVTGEKVIFSVGRTARPSDLKQQVTTTEADNCPFCPDHESQTPPEVDRLSRNGVWQTRTFPNRFPIFTRETELVCEDGMFTKLNQSGVHEVIVENPDHEKSFFSLSQHEMEDVLWTYRKRIRELSSDESLAYVLLFKNYQKAAGASLYHSHSQVIGTPFVPSRIRQELLGFQNYQQKTGKCVFCEMVDHEMNGERRVLFSENYLVIAPFAARFPYESWILPRNHQKEFAMVSDAEILELARVFWAVFANYKRVLGDIPFNLYLHNLPNRGYSDYHWHWELIPRLNNLAGFELGGGTLVNTVLPEEVATHLREFLS